MIGVRNAQGVHCRPRRFLRGAADTAAATTDALLGLTAVFPADLAADEAVREHVTHWLTELDRHGARAVVAGA